MSLDPFLENFSIDLDDEEPDTLDCEEKGIDALPEGVLSAPRLCNVEELFLDQNSLTSLPEDLGALEKLRELNVRNNALTSLPTSLGKLRALEVFFKAGQTAAPSVCRSAPSCRWRGSTRTRTA